MAMLCDVCDMIILLHSRVAVSGNQVWKISAIPGLTGANTDSRVIAFVTME